MLFSKPPSSRALPASKLPATPAVASDSELQHQVRALSSQVEQWRQHGHLLSEHVRGLQDELQSERDANQRMQQLLRAQEEKIALLENMCGAVAAPPPPEAAVPQKSPSNTPTPWLRWLGGNEGGDSYGAINAPASAWSRWLPGAPPSPPKAPPTHATTASSAPAPSPSAARLPAPPRTPLAPATPNNNASAAAAPPSLDDPASVEHYLESMAAAIAPSKPLQRPSPAGGMSADAAAPGGVTGAGVHVARTFTPGGAAGGAVPSQVTRAEGGSSSQRSTSSSSAPCALRRGVELAPFVVGLGSAQEDIVSLGEGVSPPVTTRVRGRGTGGHRGGHHRTTGSSRTGGASTITSMSGMSSVVSSVSSRGEPSPRPVLRNSGLGSLAPSPC